MPRRLRKQILYGAFYLLVFALIWGGIYFLFLKPAPSCYDKVKNQDEVEVDCGGVCSGVCSTVKIKPLESVVQILTLRPDAEHMSLFAQINNPNLDYMAKSFIYNFSLYDSSDKVVKSFRGSSFIYPGEAKYILVPNFPNIDFSRVGFTAESPEWVSSKEASGAPNLALVGAQVNMKEGKLVVEGNIVNKDVIVVGSVLALATFTGDLGQIAGVSQTEVADLSPGETRAFSIVHPNIERVDLAATKIFLYAQRSSH